MNFEEEETQSPKRFLQCLPGQILDSKHGTPGWLWILIGSAEKGSASQVFGLINSSRGRFVPWISELNVFFFSFQIMNQIRFMTAWTM